MRTKLSPMFMALVLTVATTASAQEKSPVDVDKIKRSAEREARSDSPLGCKELAQETADACVDAVTRGLKVNCNHLLIPLRMSVKQAKGQLFDVEAKGGEATNVKAANAACRVHLRSLRRKRKKVDADMTPDVPLSAECTRVSEILRTKCLPLARDGTKSQPCSTLITVISMRTSTRKTQKEAPADRCKTAAATWDRVSAQAR